MPVEDTYLVLPEIINEFGSITLNGEFQGVYNNFKTNVNISTLLGAFKLNFNLSEISKADSTIYNGHLWADKFNLGKLLDMESTLGTLNVDADINGSGLTADKLKVLVNGNIDSLYFNGNRFDSIAINANVTEEQFWVNYILKMMF